MPFWAQLLFVPLLIGLNAFFVCAEYALVSVRGSQIDALRARGATMAARSLARLKDDMGSAIGAIQVCITMTNLLLGWIGEPAMSRLLMILFGPLAAYLSDAAFRAISISLSFVVVTLLTVVLAELVPKAVTLQYTLTSARVTATPILRIQQAITPLVWLMNRLANATTRLLGLGQVSIEDAAVTPDEIRVIASESAKAGVLTPRERELILNRLTLGRRTARQVMVPRVHVAYLDLRRSMGENLVILERNLFSRMPLCDGGMDRVVGVVYTKEFLTASQDAADDPTILSLIARPAVFVPETVSLDRLLAAFYERRTHMAFLVDEYGGVAGIVTLTDVVDELLGEMREAADVIRDATATIGPSPAAAAAPDPAVDAATSASAEGRLVVPGEMPLHELTARLVRPLGPIEQIGDVTTVAGLIAARLGRLPDVGDEVAVDGVAFHVVATDGHIAQQVRVTAPPKPADPGT